MAMARGHHGAGRRASGASAVRLPPFGAALGHVARAAGALWRLANDGMDAMGAECPPVLVLVGGMAGVLAEKGWRHVRRKAKAKGLMEVQLKASPNPDWKEGERQSCPYGDDVGRHVAVAPADVPGGTYALLVSAVVPRPIALCSSISADGFVNLSPYSYFGAVSHDPPVVALGCCRSGARGGARKDTLANIEATGTFVVHIMSDWYVESANHTCGNYDPHVDEFELAGLTKRWDCRYAAAPRVAEAAVALECRVRHLHELQSPKTGKPSCTVVLGEVTMFHFHPAVYSVADGKATVDVARLNPISRLGGNTYAQVAGTFDLPRPDRRRPL